MADEVVARSDASLALAAFVEAVPRTGQALLLRESGSSVPEVRVIGLARVPFARIVRSTELGIAASDHRQEGG